MVSTYINRLSIRILIIRGNAIWLFSKMRKMEWRRKFTSTNMRARCPTVLRIDILATLGTRIQMRKGRRPRLITCLKRHMLRSSITGGATQLIWDDLLFAGMKKPRSKRNSLIIASLNLYVTWDQMKTGEQEEMKMSSICLNHCQR